MRLIVYQLPFAFIILYIPTQSKRIEFNKFVSSILVWKVLKKSATDDFFFLINYFVFNEMIFVKYNNDPQMKPSLKKKKTWLK